ncbi:MAG: YCF48-related protein [Xanthomonadales bacterium]|nr:YCF48-related protein [Xanthomonadales bacterium]
MSLAFLAFLAAGCEAPLDLEAVAAQQAKPVQRADLFQAAARHLDQVIVVGAMGVVVQSSDGGTDWQRKRLAGNPFLLDVVACPDGNFHALEKTDGLWTLQAGGEWQRQALPEATEPQAMTCDQANVIWVTGGFSTILHSADAGASWENWSMDEDLFLTSIQFVDARHGFVTGEFGTVLVSDDSGANWQPATPLPDSFYPQSAHFPSPTTGWVVGLDGMIWTTDTGGMSWQLSDSGISSPLYGITGSADRLLAIGDNTTILYHHSGDTSWHPLDTGGKQRTYLRAAASLGNGEFVVAGGGTLFTVAIPETHTPSTQGGAR